MRILLLSALFAFTCAAVSAQEVEAQTPRQLSVVRVNVTNQPWDFLRPWGKRPPFSRRAIGAVLPNGRVLVTGELVANATFIEFEAPEGGAKVSATVEVVDYDANLALLKTDDPQFLKSYSPLELTTAKVGDTVNIWQLESTGSLLVTPATLTTAEVSRYPMDDSPLLVYRMTANLQFRDSSFTMPATKDGKLVGVLMRYENNTKNTELVPAPIIEHFIKDADAAPYDGFPRVGMTFSITRDPMFRRFLGLDESVGARGLYVSQILKNSPAAQAGLQSGDVILQAAGVAIDQDGNYNDPDYGKLAITHLLSTKHYAGETIKLGILRGGQKQDVEVTLKRRPPESQVSEPYIIDRAPRFYILGGLVLQELSRQYLKEFGTDWLKRAPSDLVYLDRYQTDLFENGPEKIVILSRVLPSEATIGYEDLRGLVVTKINGVPLQSLASIPDALTKAAEGLHQIEFQDDPGRIWLDAKEAEAMGPVLQQNYRIPLLERLN